MRGKARDILISKQMYKEKNITKSKLKIKIRKIQRRNRTKKTKNKDRKND
jgi:hypothetical protein